MRAWDYIREATFASQMAGKPCTGSQALERTNLLHAFGADPIKCFTDRWSGACRAYGAAGCRRYHSAQAYWPGRSVQFCLQYRLRIPVGSTHHSLTCRVRMVVPRLLDSYKQAAGTGAVLPRPRPRLQLYLPRGPALGFRTSLQAHDSYSTVFCLWSPIVYPPTSVMSAQMGFLTVIFKYQE
jgi:hypothetical protein